MSVGIAVARNEIDSSLQAVIKGLDNLTTTLGGVSLSADESAMIDSDVKAVAVSVAASVNKGGTSFSGAGAVSRSRRPRAGRVRRAA